MPKQFKIKKKHFYIYKFAKYGHALNFIWKLFISIFVYKKRKYKIS